MNSQAIQVTDFKNPLSLVDIDVASPRENEVQVDVLACSLNFADTLIVIGKYQEKPELPFSPGMEIVGTISKIGTGVTDLKVGEKIVAVIGFGGLSRKINVQANLCFPISNKADPVIYASLPIAYGTSHLGLFHRAKLQQNETLLVLGASGGVGLTAVELGVLAGANVIACARGDEKLAVANEKGPNHLINSENTDIKEAVKALGGADVVYDPIGGDQFKAALSACNPEARILPLGFASGDIPNIPANILLVKNVSVLGFYWGAYRKFAPKVMQDSLEEIFKWTEEGRIKPHVSSVLPLERTSEGLDLLRNRKATGKVVIDMTL